MADPTPGIRDLAVIGDRRTAALLGRDGSILWYCPGRFDSPSLFAALLDPERGGAWTLDMASMSAAGRRYLEDSGVMETHLTSPQGNLTVTDWFPLGEGLPTGNCHSFSAAPAEVTVSLRAAPDYSRREPKPRHTEEAVVIDGRRYLYASHPLELRRSTVQFNIPAGEEGWAFLADASVEGLGKETLARWLAATLESWHALSAHASHRGPFEREVAVSLRALRLLTLRENGGIIAAPTVSLPEVIGGAHELRGAHIGLGLDDAAAAQAVLPPEHQEGAEEVWSHDLGRASEKGAGQAAHGCSA